MELLTTNLKPKVRHAKLEGRDYLVAPAVILTRGVHAGSNGPLLYEDTELGKTPGVWNCKPIVVYHPQANGQPVSACDPDVMNNRKVGMMLNTKYDSKTGKLKTECWMEADRLKSVDERVLNALEEGKVMELSTGLFTDNVDEEGEWNGEAYVAKATNFRPDHLALLPDQKGACSVADGAGLLQNSQPVTQDQLAVIQSFIGNELSHDEVRQELARLIRKGSNTEPMEAWVMEVYDDFFVFEKKGTLYVQGYTNKDDEVKLTGMATQVERVVRYKKSDGTFIGNQEQENQMDKKKIVDGLIANAATQWKEEDRDALMGMDEKVLAKLSPVANETETEPPTPKEKKDGEDETIATPPVVPTTENKAKSVDEFISNAPPEMQDVLRAGLETHNAEKVRLIGVITANKQNVFKPEYLNGRSLAELKGLASLAQQPQTQVQNSRSPIYSGQGEPAAPVGNTSEEPLEMPTINWGKKTE